MLEIHVQRVDVCGETRNTVGVTCAKTQQVCIGMPRVVDCIVNHTLWVDQQLVPMTAFGECQGYTVPCATTYTTQRTEEHLELEVGCTHAAHL